MGWIEIQTGQAKQSPSSVQPVWME